MGESTAIGWTDHTFNPWWGCERVSPGCQNCYAEAFAKRTGHDVWGKNADRRYFEDKHWVEPVKWNAAAAERGRRELVFCASMADVFEGRDEQLTSRERLWALIDETPFLVWQLLTKRPQNVLPLVPADWLVFGFPSNVWIGTTAEDQQRADERLPELVKIGAPVRFVSVEPMLGPVVLPNVVEWVICGGESGNGRREFDPEWARALRDQCRADGVPFFFKQVGGRFPTSGGDLLDGMQYKDFPVGAFEAVG